MLSAPIRRRTGALALLVAFVLVLVLSTTFVCLHACHEHDQQGPQGSCALCAQISAAHNLLKHFSLALLPASAALGTVAILIALACALRHKMTARTPVSLKVRLNN